MAFMASELNWNDRKYVAFERQLLSRKQRGEKFSRKVEVTVSKLLYTLAF